MRISDWSSDVCSSDLPERLPSDAEVGDNRLRNLVGVMPAPPVRAPLRRLIEWTADYYLAPTAAVARMTLASTSALEGGRTITEYRATGTQPGRSEEHTSELQSLMRISYAVFCLKKKKTTSESNTSKTKKYTNNTHKSREISYTECE